MNQPTSLPPTRLNGFEPYLRRYLNTVTDWRGYAGLEADRPSFEAKIHDITQTFFGAKQLRGLGLLLSAHALQQGTASLISLLIRSTLAGDVLDHYRGLAIRQSGAKAFWTAKTPAFLQKRIQILDGYYFHEGGRSWHYVQLEVTLPGQSKMLSILSLLSFPNRSYYFDRPLLYNQAVDIALGYQEPDTADGFIGDTNELDFILPLFRLLKLGLYFLNWLLVDNEERDNRGPSVSGYDEFGRPPGGLPGSPFSPSYPFGGQRPYPGYRAQSPSPSSTASPFGPYSQSNPYRSFQNQAPNPQTPPPAYPPYSASPPPPPPPWPASTNGQYASNGQYPPLGPNGNSGYQLVPAPVHLKITLQKSNNQVDSFWHTVSEGASLLTDSSGRQTGLAVAPLVEFNPEGLAVTRYDQWGLIHLASGALLSRKAYPKPDLAAELGLRLLELDWSRDFSAFSAPDLQRAETIIHDFEQSISSRQ